MSKRKCRHGTRSAPPCRERRRSAPSVLSACRRGVHLGVASADARATRSLRRVDRSGGAVRCRLLQSARDVDPGFHPGCSRPSIFSDARRAVPALRPRDHSDGDRSGPHGPHNRPDLVHPLPRRTGSASGLTTRARRSAILRVGRPTARSDCHRREHTTYANISGLFLVGGGSTRSVDGRACRWLVGSGQPADPTRGRRGNQRRHEQPSRAVRPGAVSLSGLAHRRRPLRPRHR